MRLSIDVTQEQHQRLKAVSALRGQSIKDYLITHETQPTLATAWASAAFWLQHSINGATYPQEQSVG
jgi:Antitoxin ParD